jgi:prepilin-type N-terminal cleavage/methylation domain-containing protein
LSQARQGSATIQRRHRRAFTLIELILVMAILTIAVSITAPALANFFHGRVLDSEARRLLAATRAAQSRAISEGVPVTLWFDSSQNEYGMEAESSYEEKDPKAETLVIDHNVTLKVTTLDIGASRANGSSGSSMGSSSGSGRSMASRPALQGPHASLPQIRFSPDGSIGEESPQMIQIIGSDENSLYLMLSRGRLNYELQSRPNT